MTRAGEGEGTGKSQTFREEKTDVIALERFLPYRLTVVANQVAAPLAREYSERFDLAVTEWRAMAILGRFPGISLSEIVERTAMDKVAVTRAISRLESAGRLDRRTDPEDRRRQILHLSEEGRAVYQQIVPYALAVEHGLFDQFTASERELLHDFLDRIEETARKLDPRSIG
jgi:DNA-binding MarR family transcriptional regulator